MKKSVIGIIALASITACSLFGTVGCSDNKSNGETALDITDSAITMDCFGSYQLETETKNVDSIKWSSSNPSVVSVDSNGRLSTTNAVGEATITAKSGNLIDNCHVTVLIKGDSPVFTVEKSDVSIAKDDSFVLHAKLYYKGLDITEYAPITFAANSDATVFSTSEATIDSVKITGNQVGTGSLTAWTKIFDTLYSVNVNVTVKELGITYTIDNGAQIGNDIGFELRYGEQHSTNDVKVFDNKTVELTNEPSKWKSANEDIVTIDEDGSLKMGRIGETTISARFGETDICLTVKVVKDYAPVVTISQVEKVDLDLKTEVTLGQNQNGKYLDGKREYFPSEDENNTVSIKLTDDASKNLGKLYKVVVGEKEMDISNASASVKDGVLTIHTRAFGANAYGSQNVSIFMEENAVIQEYACKMDFVTKTLNSREDIKNYICPQWVGETIFGYYELGKDINFENQSAAFGWHYDENNTHGFRGTLDGKDHKISNYVVPNHDGAPKYTTARVGFFAQIGNDAVIKNITFDNIKAVQGATVDSVFARYIGKATIENVTLNYDASITQTSADSGVFAEKLTDTTFSNVTVNMPNATIALLLKGGNCTYSDVTVCATKVDKFTATSSITPPGVTFKKTQSTQS